jgi:ferrochelatase
MTQSYDAVLFVSFGGPEGPDDVIPFLENVLRGRNVPPERLQAVARHYELFDGISPINEQNRALMMALSDLLEAEGPNLPIYWGNRNWHPMLRDAVQLMADDGVKRALAFVTSAYSSYSGCRQYLENIEAARAAVGPAAPVIDKIRQYYNHPGFIGPNIAQVAAALEEIRPTKRADAQLVFTAHSIPVAMAAGSKYQSQLEDAAWLVAEGVGHANWRLAFQSRSGPPTQPWLEPDISDYLREIAAAGATDVVVSPIGFISDHLEVVYDLDMEARQVADSLGLNFVRAATAGTHPDFVRMIRELIIERIDGSFVRPSMGMMGPGHDICEAGCCPSGR